MNDNKKRRGSGLSFYVILIVVIIAVSMFFSQNRRSADLSYSEMLQQINVGNVEKAVIAGNNIELKFKNSVKGSNYTSKQISPYWMNDLLQELKTAEQAHSIDFDYAEPVNVASWLNIILLVLMFSSMAFFLWLMFSKQGGGAGGAMNFARSKAKLADPEKNKVTFEDVAGAKEEKQELQEVVEFLKNPEKFEKLGAKIPRGVLLVGPPGTGKTLLAKAVAGEAKVPFYSISGSDFVEMYVGVGASRVRDLFETAKKHSPAIIFIDEIDAVGRKRGAGLGGSHDEREQTLNQLLVEMDGFGPTEDVIIIAATNRSDILDPALLRPGRFDRAVHVNRPDQNEREAILKVHARNKPIADNVDFKEIAQTTPGFTGADLANLLNEAALAAARKGQTYITYEDISASVFKVVLGPEKESKLISDKERVLTAYHEAGHALTLRSVSETEKVERVSIIPAGGAGGYTAHKPFGDIYFTTKSQIIADIKVCLGGRAAEEIYFGEVSTGASNDLEKANQSARDMITRYGMSSTLYNRVFTDDSDEVFIGGNYGNSTAYSSEVISQIDKEVSEIINSAYADVLNILRDKRQALDAMAEYLMENERMEAEVFEQIYVENTTEEQRLRDPKNEGREYTFGKKKAEFVPEESSFSPSESEADLD